MATVTKENIGLLNEKIIVTVSKEDYYPEYEKGLKEYAKKANVAGFRKGMIPMYGSQLLVEQVYKKAEKQLITYLEEQPIKLIGQPIPFEGSELLNISFNNPVDYKIYYEIGIEPEIDTDLSKANLIKYKIGITDSLIDDDLENLRYRYGIYSEPETITVADNHLTLLIKEADAEGNILNEEAEAKQMNALVKYFTESYQSSLIGKALNDSFVFKFSDDITEEVSTNLLKEAGLEKEAVADSFFKATITRIGIQDLAELNEEFYKKAFPNADINTLEELKAAIKEEVAKSFEDQSNYQLQDQIYHYYIDHLNIEMPDDFIRRFVKISIKDQNASDEELAKNIKSFRKSYIWNTVLNNYIDQFGVTIDREDYFQHAKEKMMSYMQYYSVGDNDSMAWMDSYAENMLKDKKFIEESYYELKLKKVFNEIYKTVPATSKDITLDAFKEMVDNHHHH